MSAINPDYTISQVPTFEELLLKGDKEKAADSVGPTEFKKYVRDPRLVDSKIILLEEEIAVNRSILMRMNAYFAAFSQYDACDFDLRQTEKDNPALSYALNRLFGIAQEESIDLIPLYFCQQACTILQIECPQLISVETQELITCMLYTPEKEIPPHRNPDYYIAECAVFKNGDPQWIAALTRHKNIHRALQLRIIKRLLSHFISAPAENKADLFNTNISHLLQCLPEQDSEVVDLFYKALTEPSLADLQVLGVPVNSLMYRQVIPVAPANLTSIELFDYYVCRKEPCSFSSKYNLQVAQEALGQDLRYFAKDPVVRAVVRNLISGDLQSILELQKCSVLPVTKIVKVWLPERLKERPRLDFQRVVEFVQALEYAPPFYAGASAICQNADYLAMHGLQEDAPQRLVELAFNPDLEVLDSDITAENLGFLLKRAENLKGSAVSHSFSRLLVKRIDEILSGYISRLYALFTTDPLLLALQKEGGKLRELILPNIPLNTLSFFVKYCPNIEYLEWPKGLSEGCLHDWVQETVKFQHVQEWDVSDSCVSHYEEIDGFLKKLECVRVPLSLYNVTQLLASEQILNLKLYETKGCDRKVFIPKQRALPFRNVHIEGKASFEFYIAEDVAENFYFRNVTIKDVRFNSTIFPLSVHCFQCRIETYFFPKQAVFQECQISDEVEHFNRRLTRLTL